MTTSRSREPLVLLVLGAIALAVTAYHAYDSGTWLMEVAPIFIAVPVLVATHRRFPLTPLLYRLIFLHALVLMVGGHYTYARVPLGFWAEHVFGFTRNNYDRLGHFMQGFVPSLVAREVLLRRTPLRSGKWLFFIVVCIALAVSACYEFVEWWTALLEGDKATDFLGTQGDIWDTQWDMFMALIGAISAQLLLAKLHDRELARVDPAVGSATPARPAGSA